MSSPRAIKMGGLPAFKRQHLLAEFTGLKQACPQGIFVSLTPGDPTLWSGVLFVRKGPYAPAILRFQLSFPDTYPSLPPLVTFSTDIFHPLLTPLSTYMYSTDGCGYGYGDNARFGDVGRFVVCVRAGVCADRGTFDDEDVLDSVPLEAAGNPGAWHAWRTHLRQSVGKPLPVPGGAEASGPEGELRAEKASGPAAAVPAATTRRPGEWNWEGVWEERVKRGIAASLSEGVLYGQAGTTDDVINFLSMDDTEVEGAKSNLLRTLGAAA
ncbi:hypothetical protein F5144DRAFT_648978 [Chaetomium tenue]|uniref:Uncharacterized protein n=1 Tax=Chaetomium tenue TaxID=1854479 RepID=A0ACB7P743_9PEZI|nr:hypothetical protein F5144DRAFT_648978 [Chaetomium globosum]